MNHPWFRRSGGHAGMLRRAGVSWPRQLASVQRVRKSNPGEPCTELEIIALQVLARFWPLFGLAEAFWGRLKGCST